MLSVTIPVPIRNQTVFKNKPQKRKERLPAVFVISPPASAGIIKLIEFSAYTSLCPCLFPLAAADRPHLFTSLSLFQDLLPFLPKITEIRAKI